MTKVKTKPPASVNPRRGKSRRIWRCRICGEAVAGDDAREHLVGHNQHAADMEAEDVAAQYEPISPRESV